jgi:glycosyltransferase involved in cell wall biosynthesis
MKSAVIIVTKNRESDLRRAIASALKQAVTPDVLVIDDGSVETSDMVRSEFPLVHLEQSAHSLGYIAQRNRAARLTTADVVVSIDDDAVFSSPRVVEQAVAAFDHPRVIPNTYRSEIFKGFSAIPKDLDIVYVGRLVLEKGIDDLLDALSLLGYEGVRPRLSIVGDGPSQAVLKQKTKELGLDHRVTFLGIKRGLDLAKFIARHRLMTVPSRSEPFGIVAVEGIACGCVVVGTNQGDLPEAIGPCGVAVSKTDSIALARALKLLLENEGLITHYRSSARAHLARHSREVIGRQYLKTLTAAASGSYSSKDAGALR